MPRMAIGEWETCAYVLASWPSSSSRYGNYTRSLLKWLKIVEFLSIYITLNAFSNNANDKIMDMETCAERFFFELHKTRYRRKRRTAINANNWTQWSKSIDSFNSCASSRTLALFLEMQPLSERRRKWMAVVGLPRTHSKCQVLKGGSRKLHGYLINFYMQDDVVARRTSLSLSFQTTHV